MAEVLHGTRGAAIATHGFERSELLEPKRALEDAGGRVDVIVPDDAGGGYTVQVLRADVQVCIVHT